MSRKALLSRTIVEFGGRQVGLINDNSGHSESRSTLTLVAIVLWAGTIHLRQSLLAKTSSIAATRNSSTGLKVASHMGEQRDY